MRKNIDAISAYRKLSTRIGTMKYSCITLMTYDSPIVHDIASQCDAQNERKFDSMLWVHTFRQA